MTIYTHVYMFILGLCTLLGIQIQPEGQSQAAAFGLTLWMSILHGFQDPLSSPSVGLYENSTSVVPELSYESSSLVLLKTYSLICFCCCLLLALCLPGQVLASVYPLVITTTSQAQSFHFFPILFLGPLSSPSLPPLLVTTLPDWLMPHKQSPGWVLFPQQGSGHRG